LFLSWAISGVPRKSGFQGSLYLSRESLGNSILPLFSVVAVVGVVVACVVGVVVVVVVVSVVVDP
jgi:hypothetical protein